MFYLFLEMIVVFILLLITPIILLSVSVLIVLKRMKSVNIFRVGCSRYGTFLEIEATSPQEGIHIKEDNE
ncbi:MAG: hypothetical protein J1E39_03615 [Eubacterium sp.]|nr:hypothetical protein [Eubacterium sp.]